MTIRCLGAVFDAKRQGWRACSFSANGSGYCVHHEKQRNRGDSVAMLPRLLQSPPVPTHPRLSELEAANMDAAMGGRSYRLAAGLPPKTVPGDRTGHVSQGGAPASRGLIIRGL